MNLKKYDIIFKKKGSFSLFGLKIVHLTYYNRLEKYFEGE